MAKTSFQIGSGSKSYWQVWKSHLSTFYAFCRNSIYMPKILCNKCSALHSSRSRLLLRCNVLWTLLNISAHLFSQTSWEYAQTFISRHWTTFIHVRISGTALHLYFFLLKRHLPVFQLSLSCTVAPKAACAVLLVLLCLKKAEISPEVIQMSLSWIYIFSKAFRLGFSNG